MASNTIESARVLVVEDERPIREGLVDLLGQTGFEVSACACGDDALSFLRETHVDLVLLDLMLPGTPGLEVLKALRSQGNHTPVLVLTAKGAEEDIVAGLEAGADDYVTKPFGIRELVARARGLLRRHAPSSAPTVRIADVQLDFEALTVSWNGGHIRLSAREGSLLQYLHAHRDRAVPRDELLVKVWGYQDGTIRTRTVDVHVQQLRGKLQPVPGSSTWIQTVRSRGYRFRT